jgi:hypothetical protein
MESKIIQLKKIEWKKTNKKGLGWKKYVWTVVSTSKFLNYIDNTFYSTYYYL